MYALSGPLQNIEAKETYSKMYFFGVGLASDLGVETFFWISAFLASYKMLESIHLNEGKWPVGKAWFILDRFVRFAPLYYIVLLIFWRIVPLIGGDGPIFFTYH